MKNLNNTLQSVIKSYNNQESINFVDLQFIDNEFQGMEIVNEFISNYDKREVLNFLLVQKLDLLINKK